MFYMGIDDPCLNNSNMVGRKIQTWVIENSNMVGRKYGLSKIQTSQGGSPAHQKCTIQTWVIRIQTWSVEKFKHGSSKFKHGRSENSNMGHIKN
jgi:hypothetical protein